MSIEISLNGTLSNFEVGQLWLNTSVVPGVLNRWTGLEWAKASPTEASDIGAETPDGAQSKADDAADNLAIELGYEDYADMVDKAQSQGTMLLVGGYLNADLIEAGTISSDHIVTTGLDASVIKTGKLDAGRIQLGASSTFADGYDPTDKAEEIKGRNLFLKENLRRNHYLDIYTGLLEQDFTGDAYDYTEVSPSSYYTVSGTFKYLNVVFYNDSKVKIGSDTTNETLSQWTFQTVAGTKYLRFGAYTDYVGAGDSAMWKLEKGSSATPWSPAPEDAYTLLDVLGDGKYSGGTFIDGTTVISPTIIGLQGTFADLMAGDPFGARLELGESDEGPFLDMFDENEQLRVKMLQDKMEFSDELGRFGGALGAIRITLPGIDSAVTLLESLTYLYVGVGPNIKGMLQREEDSVFGGLLCRLENNDEPYASLSAGRVTTERAYYSYISLKEDINIINALGGDINIRTIAGTIFIENIAATASAANFRIDPTTGQLFRSTSTTKYKTDIEPIEDNRAEAFLEYCQPSWYRSLCKNDRKDWSWYGYIADDIAKVEPRLVDFNADGEPVGFAYDHVVPLLHVVIRNNRRMIESVEERLDTIEKRLATNGGKENGEIAGPAGQS